MQRAIQTCIMRGGTSKGVFLRAGDLPPPGPLRDAVILRIFGSPDPRQIDGLGGADTLTSKLAIIGPPSVPTADVDYTFGQVSFVEHQVDYGGNCGNISSAVGPYAIDKGYLTIAPGETQKVVCVHNTNTGALLKCTVHLSDTGRAMVEGDMQIAGVPGSGAPVDLDFSATQGSVTGRLLPSGQLKELLTVPCGTGEEELEVTLLDAGQPMVFLRASDLFKLDPKWATATVREQAEALKKDPELLQRVERIRGVAAVQMGIVKRWQDAERDSPYTPFVAAISPPANQDSDFSSLCVFMQKIHQAYPVTGSVATAAAALLEGSILQEAGLRPFGRPEAVVRIGHPSGVMEVDTAIKMDPPELVRAALRRTARCLMDGQAYIPWSVWPE
ncbi:3-methylitaconate isomerase ((R)-3-methylitaconate isomerase) (3-methylitaconate delta-isomerase) [Durusdinium trenchii]|uniref:3-methylitaconate isomerase ((R)-3-methylitaconate isomerase) (3-methylitaconate delta-isomerase) n=1 Tax=Durusdinium trenchii TaxID=1381693 RepID=A0ABP0RKD6_9DINO